MNTESAAGRQPWAAQVRHLASAAAVFACTLSVYAAPPAPPRIVSPGTNDALVYDADERGNRVPDFSNCGYAGGDRAIPVAPVRVVVAPAGGDSTARIQTAIDYVATLPPDSNGVRGAVLLLKGRHEVSGGLLLNASGVVLRGQGMDAGGTALVSTGLDRPTLIRIAGRNDRSNQAKPSLQIKDDYVPVGATSFRLTDAGGLKSGDAINIIRPSTKAWIERLGATEFGGGEGDWRLTWKPGSRDLIWDRVIKSVAGDLVTVDAPITTAIETGFGGGRVESYSWPGRIDNVGVENLRLISTFDAGNPKDENHSWMAIMMENAANTWVRQVTAQHFAGSMVAIYESCKCVTVQDCLSLAPVSEDGGYRRNTFFTMGQMTLFLRCYAEFGRHDFSAGHCAAGPNAFVQCEATLSTRDSGPIESWSSGVLYDNVRIDGNGLNLAYRGSRAQGAGWSAANCVLWQCSAAVIRCENPPTAQNWAFGCWAEYEGNGIWRSSTEFVRPESLYAAQLADRLGSQAAARLQLMPLPKDASSNPTIEKAAELVAASRKPAPQLSDYIADASRRDPIPSEPGNAKRVEDVPSGGSRGNEAPASDPASRIPHPASGQSLLTPAAAGRLVLTNGWLACDGRLLVGGSANVEYWKGNVRPGEAASFGRGVTRFVPGRIGPGLTDDLDELADSMVANGQAALDFHYALWYDRRRGDHQRVRRMTGDVWPPFLELPFARSGQGTAWDGLSKYDLTKFNPWYWARLRQFADICGQRGLVLFHQNYFQHNIIEAGAHWADFPWRTANNINNTGFPEPPSYAGDKRIFMAEQFYDVTQPVRRELHRHYIRKCLESFADKSNVIQFTSEEFTGPAAFVQFWLDTIGEWERETGLKPLVALSCTKDAQDVILADPKRSGLVDVIDFRYWWQTDKGLYAPKGGLSLAPRQFQRQSRSGPPSDANLAQMAADYRARFPAKAIICDFGSAAWAYVCAGGSMPRLPAATDVRLLAAIPQMQPWPQASNANCRVLREAGRQYLVWLNPQGPAELDLTNEAGKFTVRSVSPHTGEVRALPDLLTGGKKVSLSGFLNGGQGVLWLTREK